MTHNKSSETGNREKTRNWPSWLALACLAAIVVPVEWSNWRSLPEQSLVSWLLNWNVDTSPYFVLLLVFPAFYWKRQISVFLGERPELWLRRFLAACKRNRPEEGQRRDWFAIGAAAFVSCVSLAMSAWTASLPVLDDDPTAWGDLPPAFHDEYSYLFQAETLLGGRFAYPSHAVMPELFDQIHVLNEGRFASRYYPGTGLWMAPFVAAGRPIWGHWVAGALICALIFGAGREMVGNGVGLLAGLLTALSPGMALFGNLLLAHHPTLVGLSWFLFWFLRMRKSFSWQSACCAGAGLSYAMLCRPMTAFGFGLPFGIWFCWLLLRRPERADVTPGKRLRLLLAMGGPLAAGWMIMLSYNHAVTGSWTKMPYQQYTDIYSPRHVYGFNNVVRGEEQLGPKVLDRYDRWAKNLTPRLAVQNVVARMLASLQWSLGIVPLAMGLIIGLFSRNKPDGWWVLPAAIVSLHLVHVPYWLDGIMQWHYVFETGPLWLLIFAVATVQWSDGWRQEGDSSFGMQAWLGLLVLTAVAISCVAVPPFWTMSRIAAGANHLGYPRFKHAWVNGVIEQGVAKRPALVLIVHDPDDVHNDFIYNRPDLQADVLRGRYRPDKALLEDIVQAFPKRTCYVYFVKEGRLVEARRADRRSGPIRAWFAMTGQWTASVSTCPLRAKKDRKKRASHGLGKGDPRGI